jgi:hypothetical protein
MRRNGVVRLREIVGLRSRSRKNAKLIAAIHRTGFFDAAYYLANNPDVAANGIDPALHFAQRGWKEGRKPGLGAAMTVGALAARRMGARLRLATRHVPPYPAELGHVLKVNRIQWDGAMDFAHIPLVGDRPLALGDGDILWTTSWWTTRSALGRQGGAMIGADCCWIARRTCSIRKLGHLNPDAPGNKSLDAARRIAQRRRRLSVASAAARRGQFGSDGRTRRIEEALALRDLLD